MFFYDFQQFNEKIALIDAADGEQISYRELAIKTDALAAMVGGDKELVFIETRNTITSVICYLGCLKANKVVYLLDDLAGGKSRDLIDLYQPNLLIDSSGQIHRNSAQVYPLHGDLTLLLSTSGTTGTPKFVKLSAANIQSNAESITEYLHLNETDIALAHLKLHYSYGLSILHSHLQVGACTVFTDKSVVEEGFWQDLVTYSATSFAGVPYTFEALLKADFDFKKYPSLRYVTLAGGKLEDFIVKDYAQRAKDNGIEFFVMYGQTEAAPRISYLPPELATAFPGSIGRAIPHGELFLFDEQGRQIFALDQPGELAYRGANVMMGYAETIADLATDETPDVLLTGDIACRTHHDLFYIVGRTKRFVKIFGLRINLDDVQCFVKTLHPQSAVTGNDNAIIVALETDENFNPQNLVHTLSEHYSLPGEKFAIKIFQSLPLLASGKYDLKTIADSGQEKQSKGFIERAMARITDILELNEKEWDSIATLYTEALGLKELELDDSFDRLNSDSLSFVYLSVELEQCLGSELPDNWQQCSVAELERIYTAVRLNG